MSAESRPGAKDIAQSQDTESNLRRQLAARRIYKRGKWLHFGGASVALLLALVSPVVLLREPDLGPTLGAVAGLWIFASRLVFEPLRLSLQERGARLQEMFDCSVLALEWNEALCRRVSEEEVRKASRRLAKASGIKAWYPTPADCPWPTSVLICQRSNVVWARRQHRTYAVVLIFGAVAWAMIGIAVSLAQSTTLAQYLTTIALPSLPAVLDAGEIARRHLQAADARSRLEERVDTLIRTPTSAVDDHDLREIQDQLYVLRAEAPLVPEWFYKLVRDNYENDMQYAAAQVSEDRSHGD